MEMDYIEVPRFRRTVGRGTIDVSALRTLEDVRDELVTIADREDPADVTAPASHWAVDFHPQLQARKLLRDGTYTPAVRFTEESMKQLASFVLPGHSWSSTFEPLMGKGEPGRKVAGYAMALFMRDRDKPIVARTVLNTDGRTRRFRGWVSTGYAVDMDDVRTVEAALADPGFRDLPVLAMDRTDTAMRVTLAGVAADVLVDQDPKTPFPTYTLFNNSVGKGSVGVSAGMYHLWCTNGAASLREQARYAFRHVGNADRLEGMLTGALDTLAIEAMGTVSAYNAAVNTAIDDFGDFLRSTLQAAQAPIILAEQIMATVEASPLVIHRDRSVASVYDALTVMAQERKTIEGQRLLEDLAMFAVQRGLDHASNGRVPILARVAPQEAQAK